MNVILSQETIDIQEMPDVFTVRVLCMKGEDGQSCVIDTTLTHAGEAADAKAVGDALALKLTKNSANEKIVKGIADSAIYGSSYTDTEEQVTYYPSAGHKALTWSIFELTGDLSNDTVADVIITNAADLLSFANATKANSYEGKYIKLTADIDLNPNWVASSIAPTVLWPVIGKSGNSNAYMFKGIFDGQGHTIRGLYAKAISGGDGVGFCFANLGTIKNLRIENSYFEGIGNTNGVGSICAILFDTGVVENCYSDAILVNGYYNVGGIVGRVSNTGGQSGAAKTCYIRKCWFNGYLSNGSYSAGGYNSGGILGAVINNPNIVNISDCLMTGSVVLSNQRACGGILACEMNAASAVISRCIVSGLVQSAGGGATGALIGSINTANKVTIGSTVYATSESCAVGTGGIGNGTASGAAIITAKSSISGAGGISLANNLNSNGMTWGYRYDDVPAILVLMPLTYLVEFTDEAQPAVGQGTEVSITAGYQASYCGYVVDSDDYHYYISLYASLSSAWSPANHIDDEDEGYLWFPDYPSIGAIDKGDGATSLGMANKANESGATAIGLLNTSDGKYSISAGVNNKAGHAAMAIGGGNTVKGRYAQAFGYENEADGSPSLAIGEANIARANSSAAIGNGNQALGYGSHATGIGTIARYGQHTGGRWNVDDTTAQYVDIVGWGNSAIARKNICALTRTGDQRLKGDIYVHCADDSTGGIVLPKIPSITIALGIINGIMTALVTKVLSSAATNVCTSIDTTADNTLHSALDQAKATYGNTLTIVKAGDTERTMLFQYDNHNANGGIYSCSGFYVDDNNAVFMTFRLVVEWNRISVFATKHTYVA